MEIAGYRFPDNLRYDRNHFWARVENDLVAMGATEFATKLAGELTYVELPEEGDQVTQGKPFGSLESGKWVGRSYAMFSGQVAEVNRELEDAPELINRDPYGAWLIKIRPADLAGEMANLLDLAALAEFIPQEIKRIAE